MRRNSGYKPVLLITALILLIVIVLLITLSGRVKQTDEYTVGIVLSGGAEENGWNGSNYEGAVKACENLGVRLLVKEHVQEYSGQCGEAVKALVEEGAGMIMLTSYGYSEEMQDLIKDYPDIVFNVNSPEYHMDNMTSYFVRMYQARYLSGIIAGMRTSSNVIGYVAAMPNNEVNRGIDAFTLGVRRVNPAAKVVVFWTGEWDNKEQELTAVDKLVNDRHADVITYHQNQDNVIDAADAEEVDSIGYHQEFTQYSPHHLTAIVCDWETVYEEMIGDYLKGRGNSSDNYWIGMEAGAVELAPYSEYVTPDIQAAVEDVKNEIMEGKEIFSGEVYDTEGNLRCGESEIISDEALLEHVDWYVEGVEFYEENMDEKK